MRSFALVINRCLLSTSDFPKKNKSSLSLGKPTHRHVLYKGKDGIGD
jgi:hypothetical protein